MSEALTAEDYEAAMDDHRRLVRMLDVALHGEGNAAPQASLCDLIEPARQLRLDHINLLKAVLCEPDGVTLANRLTRRVLDARENA